MTSRDKKFINVVWSHYEKYGRHDLPWRQASHLLPYRILLSEIMLQQTQAERVVPKYQAFLKQFPSARSLAAAPLGEVLMSWQGLGYNRRAKLLSECVRRVVSEHNGRFPRTETALEALPGIGPYTAAAVVAFAYNEPVVLIETNVRTVYLHHFHDTKEQVSDQLIRKDIERTLSSDRPREWYWALMDYGAHLKRTVGNPNTRSKHYVKQSRFRGSDREIRGSILRVLVNANSSMTLEAFRLHLQTFEQGRLEVQLSALQQEGLIKKERGRYSLPT